MEISKNMEMVNLALYLKEEEILIINDLHLGYEETLQQKGFLIPKFQIKEIIKQLERILKQVKPKLIIFNGDFKHNFPKILKDEWRDALTLIDFLLKRKIRIVIIQGNHDPTVKPIAEKRGIRVIKEYKINDVLITHGDKLVETKAKTIIIGHEHPAVTIKDKSKWEKYKCFLRGKWKNKILIVTPSFNPLIEGTDILKEKLISPFLENIKNFEVFVVGKEEVFEFGKMKNLIL